MATGGDCGIRLRHALAFAGDLWRTCLINGVAADRAAKSLGLSAGQTRGAVALLRSCETCPSPERLALVVMKDPGLDDADIAEMFGRSERWASIVRSQAQEIRSEEHIRPELEYLDDGLRPGDPMPAELWQMAADLRAVRKPGPGRRTDLDNRRTRGPRAYSWRGDAFLSFRA